MLNSIRVEVVPNSMFGGDITYGLTGDGEVLLNDIGDFFLYLK